MTCHNLCSIRRFDGCLYGGAIGDALGAPPEWKMPAEIRSATDGSPTLSKGGTVHHPSAKGMARYTDDTHMIQILSQIYIDQATILMSTSSHRKSCRLSPMNLAMSPEYGKEMLLLDRLFYPEKWLFIRLRLANVDPRIGGQGNMVNCGAAMYASPVGIVNACNPVTAYSEAIEIFSAHQQSYGLEAAGIMAACVAEAFNPDASVESIVEVALALAKEGTRDAIEAVVDCARDRRVTGNPPSDRCETLFRPFDGCPDDRSDRSHVTDNWNPSRTHSIEEVPVALGFLVVTGGDYEQSIFGGANTDEIAIPSQVWPARLRALCIVRGHPRRWMATIDEANRVDLSSLRLN